MEKNYTLNKSCYKDCNLNIDITIDDQSWFDLIPNINECIEKTSEIVFLKLKLFELVQNIEFSVHLCKDDFIKELNNKYRHKNQPTNCLSFPAEELMPRNLSQENFPFKEAFLGDIIISLETTRNESHMQNKIFKDHFSHLLVHSILHLFGYDHENDEDAGIMENLEIVILSNIGISSPYEKFNNNNNGL